MRAARELRSPLTAALALTGAVFFFGGGAGSGTLPWMGGAAVVAAAVLAASRGLPGGTVLVLPLAALAVWCAIAIAWSIEPDRSWEYANRTAVYAAFALVGVHLAGRTRELALGLAGLLGAVCAWSLAGKVLPWLYEDYGRIARLRGPVGYWNALALLGDIALPLGLWLATRRRAEGTLLVYGWAVAIALTYSRGGIVVALLVVAAWLTVSGFWLRGLATLVSAGVPAAAVIGIAFSLDGVTSDLAPHSTRVRDGAFFGVALIVGAVVAVVLSRIPAPEPVPAVRRAAIALAVVVAAAVCLVGGFHARTWWNQFTAPASAGLSNSKGRLTEASSNHRWLWWKEAWHGFRGHELGGTGPGSFEFTNLRYRESTVDRALEPHDLPVQFLSETGAVGLVLFLLAGFGLVLAPRRMTDPETALALVLPAYLLHGLIDIDWDFAAISAPVFLVAGALAARPLARPRASFPAGVAAAGLTLAVVSSLFAVWLGSRWTGQAEDLVVSNPKRAVTLAKRARSVQPLAVEPIIYAQALAEQVQRHFSKTLGLLQKATRLQPENSETWYALGEFNLRVRNCPRLALRDFERSYQLNPQDPGITEKDVALKRVNSGNALC
jgi:O-Antigen ligase